MPALCVFAHKAPNLVVGFLLLPVPQVALALLLRGLRRRLSRTLRGGGGGGFGEASYVSMGVIKMSDSRSIQTLGVEF